VRQSGSQEATLPQSKEGRWQWPRTKRGWQKDDLTQCGKTGHATVSYWKDPRNAEWLKKMSRGNQEVSNVGASVFEVLCCSVCDDPTEIQDCDLFEDRQRVQVPAADIMVKELSSDSGLEVCMKMHDVQMFPVVLQLLPDPIIWIGDAGASVDMTPVSEGLTNARPCVISVHVGNNEHTVATHSGTLSVTVCHNTGLELYKVSSIWCLNPLTISLVLYHPTDGKRLGTIGRQN
jgi:hypothetical protein